MLETTRQLAARFERCEIDRTEFQSLMAIHARELIAEIHVGIFGARNWAGIVFRRDSDWRLEALSFSKGAGRA